MTARPTRQKHHRPRNILGLAQPPTRIPLRQRLLPARHLHQPVRHPTREEARRDGVHEDPSGPELDGEVLGQMDDGGLGGRVAKCRICAEGTDADASYGGGDYYAGGVLDRGALLEEGRESVLWWGELVGCSVVRLYCLLERICLQRLPTSHIPRAKRKAGEKGRRRRHDIRKK